MPERYRPEISDYGDKVKRWGRLGVAAAILFYGGLMQERQVQAQTSTKKPTAERSSGQREKEKAGPLTSEAELRRGLLTDKNEQSYFSTDQSSTGQLEKFGKTSEAQTFITDQGIEEILRRYPGIKHIILGHTHPLAAYKFVRTEQEIEQVRTGQKDIGPMTPSVWDYQTVAYFQHRLKDRGIAVSGEVIALHGKFNYKVDSDNPLFSSLRRFDQERKEQAAKITAEERKIIKQVIDSGVDSRILIETLANSTPKDPDYLAKRKLAEKLGALEAKLSKPYSAVMEAAEAMEVLNEEIANINPSDKAVLREKIGQLQELCRRNGIILEYQPQE